MKIRFERSGGFAGLRTSGNIDTAVLPPAEGKNVRELVESAAFFTLPEKFPKPERGADYFLYRITVEDEGRSHTVEVADPAAPESLKPLIRYLAGRKK